MGFAEHVVGRAGSKGALTILHRCKKCGIPGAAVRTAALLVNVNCHRTVR